MSSSISNNGLYNKEFNENTRHHEFTFKFEGMPQTQRMQLATKNPHPQEALSKLLKTREQWQSLGYQDISDGIPIDKIGHDKRRKHTKYTFPAQQHFSTEDVHNLKLMPLMEKAREIIARRDFKRFLDSARTSADIERRGMAMDTSVTVTQGHHQHGIHLGHQAELTNKPGNEEMCALLTNLNHLLAQISIAIYQQIIPPGTELHDVLKRDWATNGSITMGHEDQYHTTSVQLTYVDIGHRAPGSEKKEADKALKLRSHDHVDVNDDPLRPSIWMNLSNDLPPDFAPGYMLFKGLGTVFPCDPFTITVFSGRDLHTSAGYGFYDKNTPEEQRYQSPKQPWFPKALVGDNYYKGVIKLTFYCRSDSLKARKNEIHPDLFDNHKSLVHLGTPLNLCETRLRHDIKHRAEHEAESLAERTSTPNGLRAFAQELSRYHHWTDPTTGEVTYARASLAEYCLGEIRKGYMKPGTLKNPDFTNKDPKLLLRDAAMDTLCGSRVENTREPGSKMAERFAANQRSQKCKKAGETKTLCPGTKKDGQPCGRRHYGGWCPNHLRQKPKDPTQDAGSHDGNLEAALQDSVERGGKRRKLDDMVAQDQNDVMGNVDMERDDDLMEAEGAGQEDDNAAAKKSSPSKKRKERSV